MEWIANPDIWVGLLTLTALEIVLGIDNLVFIAILVDRVDKARQPLARTFGISLALGTRLILLFSLTWIMSLTEPLFSVVGEEISWRDLILLAGGLFLIAKAVYEIDHKLEGEEEASSAKKATTGFVAVVVQIAVIDIVFSFDSVITAVGVAKHIEVMIAAIVISMAVMLAAAGAVSGFVNRHPTVKMLALSFLILIGVMLVADGVGFHIPKGYIYFAMAFAILVESLNMLVRRARKRQRGAVAQSSGSGSSDAGK